MTNPLMTRLKKNSSLDHAEVLADDEMFHGRDVIRTAIPGVNIAFSGDLDGGFQSGLVLFCGNSKMFKSGYGLLMVKSYLDMYEDAVCLFYNNEFGAPPAYWESYNIDMNRVLHCPFTDIEKLTFDLMKQLNELNRGDHVIIFIDSIGNAASKREVENALGENSAEDMTRAKKLKSTFRMVTPHLAMKNIPMVAVNHIYMTQEKYSKAVVSGGTGIYLSADEIFIVTRQTDKDGNEISGYNFILNVEKSRHVKEKSKIPVSVSYKHGIDKYSGIMDLAIECGLIVQAGAWYQIVDPETGEVQPKKVRSTAVETPEVMEPILKSEKFKQFVRNKYQMTGSKMIDAHKEAEEFIENLEEEEDAVD